MSTLVPNEIDTFKIERKIHHLVFYYCLNTNTIILKVLTITLLRISRAHADIHIFIHLNIHDFHKVFWQQPHLYEVTK